MYVLLYSVYVNAKWILYLFIIDIVMCIKFKYDEMQVSRKFFFPFVLFEVIIGVSLQK